MTERVSYNGCTSKGDFMIPVIVQEIISALALRGIQIVLAGGAVRDLYHGKTPKDWDLTVLGKVKPTVVHTALCVMGLDAYWYEHYMQTQDEIFLGVYKVPSYNLDIIFTHNTYHTPEEVIESFDSNLNKYWYDVKEQVIKFADDASHLTGTIKVNNSIRLTDKDRMVYLAEKYPEYKLV